MLHKLYIDIETYSATDLRTAGVYRYVEDPDWRILMTAYALDDEPVRLVEGPEETAAIPGLWDPSVLKVAHNAAFERINFSMLRFGRPGRYLPPEEYHDTMAVAAERGLPRSLAALVRAVGASEKDEAGTRLINRFSKPHAGRRMTAEDKPEDWAAFCAYCVQDVETLRDIDRAIGDFPTEHEREVFHTDQRINDRGIAADLQLARAAITAAEKNARRHQRELIELTGLGNPNSVAQLTKWTGLPNLRQATVAAELQRDDLDPTLRRVLELRQDLALVASKKYLAAVNGASSDGRLRGQLRFYGAHTGRWSGRGVQLQNLPRERFTDAQEEAVALLDVSLSAEGDDLTLKRLVRPMFTGPFVVVDYSAIEARVVAWLAGEQWALEAFEGGRDIYVETATRMSTPGNQLTRAQGKVAVLALGYNGGVNSLRVMGADGDDTTLQHLVRQWRRANPAIVGLWRLLERAFYAGGRAGRLRVHAKGDVRRVILPSGRTLTYRGVHFTPDPSGRGKRAAFRDARGVMIDTYGGRLTENATQAVARDVLADALVRLDGAGWPVVGHVHDEVLVEAPPAAYDEIRALVETPPSWADGLPIAGAGYAAPRYKKD